MRGEGETASRIVTGPDPDRVRERVPFCVAIVADVILCMQFYCPFPGCNRSFAELWRLKVHFRAPPDVRGSGKERGHGTELKYCPKCGKELKPGKHHVGCTAGKSAPRQAAKRQKQVSTTTETGDWVTQSSPSDSLDYDDEVRLAKQNMMENAIRRRASRVRRQGSSAVSLSKDCRVERELDGSHEREMGTQQDGDVLSDNADLVFTDQMKERTLGHLDHAPTLSSLDVGDVPLGYDEHLLPDLNMSGNGKRAPSPPPLPSEWDLEPLGYSGGGLLFDFDQFDEAKRPRIGGGDGEPLMTVTSAMNPSEVSNPSDDYIWQIMFAGENDPVPKRVTAHLHNPFERRAGSPDLGSIFDDGILGNNMLPPVPGNGTVQKIEHTLPPPPPPPGILQTGAGEEESKTVTVTYVVKDGQYSVKHVTDHP